MNRIIAVALVLTVTSLQAQLSDLPLYTQQLTVEFKSENAAANAGLKVLPLWQGKDYAVSARWDDNNTDNMVVRDLMNEMGYKGTFYLNSKYGWHAPSEVDYRFEGDLKNDLARQLQQGGHSIGSHTQSHEHLTAYNRNEAFFEVMANRIEREVDSQSPVVSFVFPFTSMRPAMESDAGQKDLAEILQRAGLYHVSTPQFNQTIKSDLLDAEFLSVDGQQRPVQPIADHRLYVHSMHAWAHAWGGKNFPTLRSFLETSGGKTQAWYCNQNEYAAYRGQVLLTTFESKRAGSSVTWLIQRPSAADLGSDIPLSVQLGGVKSSSIKSVTLGDGGRVKQFKTKAGGFAFDLLHTEKLPGAFGAAHNSDNSDAMELLPVNLKGISARLVKTEKSLVLRLLNEGENLTRLRVKFRVPLRYRQDEAKTMPDLHGFSRGELEQELAVIRYDFVYNAGRRYFAAQVDCLRGGSPVRFWVGTEVPEEKADPAFARDGFLVLGPLAGSRDDFNPVDLFATIKADKSRCYNVFGQVEACWQEIAASSTQVLTPDIIFGGGKPATRTFYKWDTSLYYPHGSKLHYIYWARVYTPIEIEASALYDRKDVEAVRVNGKKVSGRFMLNTGLNDIEILHYPKLAWGEFGDNQYGCWFRLVDTDGNRVENIEYRRPPLN